MSEALGSLLNSTLISSCNNGFDATSPDHHKMEPKTTRSNSVALFPSGDPIPDHPVVLCSIDSLETGDFEYDGFTIKMISGTRADNDHATWRRAAGANAGSMEDPWLMS